MFLKREQQHTNYSLYCGTYENETHPLWQNYFENN